MNEIYLLMYKGDGDKHITEGLTNYVLFTLCNVKYL